MHSINASSLARCLNLASMAIPCRIKDDALAQSRETPTLACKTFLAFVNIFVNEPRRPLLEKMNKKKERTRVDVSRVQKGNQKHSALHMLQRLVRRQVAFKVVDPGVDRRTRGHVLVHGRHLLVPTDAHARPLRDRGLELHPQHPRRARRRGALGQFAKRLLFRDDDFEDEVVVHGEAVGRVDVAHGAMVVFDGGHEFHGDLTALGIEIRLPSALEIFVTD